jgi:hypothetical protein
VVSAGTIIRIEDESGREVLTFAPIRAYQSVVFSSTELADGTTYVVYREGSSSGTKVDCVISGGTYTPGSELSTVTISDVVTYVGSYSGGGFMCGPGGQWPPRPGG